MARQELVVGAVLLAVFANVQIVNAQDSGRTSSLVDRLISLRKGWSGRSQQEPAPQSQQAQPRAVAAAKPSDTISPEPRYPRIDARRLLPQDYSNAPRRYSDSALQPPADSNTASRTGQRPASRPSSLSQGGVEKLLPFAERPGKQQKIAADRLREPSAHGTTLENGASRKRPIIDTQVQPPSRKSPSVRRSPRSGPNYDFDPDELRRDLHDAPETPVKDDEATAEHALLPAPSKIAEEQADLGVGESDDRLPTSRGEASYGKQEQQEADQNTYSAEDHQIATPPAELSELPAQESPDQGLTPKELGGLPTPQRLNAHTPHELPVSSVKAPTVVDVPVRTGTPTEAGSARQPSVASPPDPSAAPVSQQAVQPTPDDPMYAGEEFREDRRVQLEGEKAFTPKEENIDQGLPTNPFHGGPDSPTKEPSNTAHTIGSAYGRESFAAGTRSTVPGETVLATDRMPMISSEVAGPRQILIGREASYTIRLLNQSTVAANEVVAKVRVPAWADVVDTTATNGIIQRAQDPHEPNTFRWQLHSLEKQSSESLELKLIPRSSRPLELGVDWSYAPIGSKAVVEVQEPKLRMHVSGPDEVLYGKRQLYRLTLTNPGTGVAEDVRIDLMPPGGGEQTVSSHQVGKLLPGTSKSVEVELTAREPGKLFVKALATAVGDISAEAAKEIFCRKPELEVDWRGPEQKYAGTVATYFFRVRNPGTAPADDVQVEVRLPQGVEFLKASEGQMLDRSRETVRWRIASLRPGDDYYMEMKCLLNAAGLNAFNITATTASGELTDHRLAETNVIALADLKLEVTDPQGPIPVGEEAVYEIRVRNRGTNTAEDVNIAALFSEGIEAESVEGAQSTIADGRVTFRTIEKLPAGREIVLRIRARATSAGTHIFRAEVLCRDLEIKLAAEETTRFFQDETLGGLNPLAPQSAIRDRIFESAAGDRY